MRVSLVERGVGGGKEEVGEEGRSVMASNGEEVEKVAAVIGWFSGEGGGASGGVSLVKRKEVGKGMVVVAAMERKKRKW